MCTLSYIPKGKQDFILTSNRDEQASRSPESITRVQEKTSQLIFPRDTEAGGTWIAASDRDQVVCVLNGAFEMHQRNLPYRRSRGLMVLDFFAFERAETFFNNYVFEGMESFTFLVYEHGRLFEFRWDENRKYLLELDPQKAHFWSSATLYSTAMREKRASWFWDWYENQNDFTREAVMKLHLTGGEGDPFNDFVMNRHGLVQTVSITSIEKTAGLIKMHYHDLLRNRMTNKSLVYATNRSAQKI